MQKTVSVLLLCIAVILLFTQAFMSSAGDVQPAAFLPVVAQNSNMVIPPTATHTPTSTPTNTTSATPSHTTTATPTATASNTHTATSTPSLTATFTPTPTSPAVCPTQFEEILTAGAIFVPITAEIGQFLTITDLTIGQVIGTDTAQAISGHLCPGFAFVAVSSLVAGHIISVESTNGTFDIESVQANLPTSTPTFTPTPTSPAVCPTQFEGTLTAGAILVAITAEVGQFLAVTDLSTGQTIGTGTAQTETGHLCPGFALVPVTPLVIGHLIVVESNNSTFDIKTVQAGQPTPTPTLTPTPIVCPTQFEETLTAGAVLVAITAEVGEMLTVTDLTTGGLIGTGTAQAEAGHLCPGFALVSVTPLVTNHTIIVESSNNTFDIAMIDCTFGPYPLNANGVTTIEAENFICGGEGIAYHDEDVANQGGTYRLTEGVDIQITSDTGGGFNVGWIRDGEWLKYKFYVASANIYAINFRYATNNSNARLQLFIDNVDIGAGVIQLPNTGGLQNWATYYTSNTFLNPGVHTLEVRFIRGPLNFNYSQFTAGGFSTPTPIPTNTPTPTPTSTNTPTPTPTPNTSQAVFYSLDAEDGFIIELNATGTGDTMDSDGVIEIGDTGSNNNNGRRQRKGILSFDTSALPDNAVITSAVLRVQRESVVGDPSNLVPLWVDIAPTNGFNSSYTLEKQDFQASPAANQVGTFPLPATNGAWTETTLNSNALTYINTTGKTQFRLYFASRTDGDSNNDKLIIKSGSSASAKPQLIVTYTIGHVPVAQFTSSVVSGTLPLEVALDNNSFDPDGTISASQWDFGDGVTRAFAGLGSHTAHVFTQPGTFTITLTITDNTGLVDTAVLPITVLDNLLYTGCPAQPIGIHIGINSLYPEVYPSLTWFNYPSNPPTYADFPYNEPNVPLHLAQTGYVYRVLNGFSTGNFSWLKWNQYLTGNTTNLQASLGWPGNNEDYLSVASGQLPPGTNPVTNEPFTHPVYGFINIVDDNDFVLQEGDWVSVSGGILATAYNSLNNHIDQQKLLRLPLWENSGSNSIQMTQFAWFKLQGYHNTNSQGGAGLLVEFVEFDEQCGQVSTP